ncbi:MAG TPA: carbon storage regulator CsrA [Candidatus Andersenbacteria bacterium]|nr:carbon storage regulator CsrA [Candidatus Andersenbacteria bacterium]
MLVLTRKRNESIIIDGSITIKVLEIRGPLVKLGIEAPAEIPIHRMEIWQAMAAKAETEKGSDATP